MRVLAWEAGARYMMWIESASAIIRSSARSLPHLDLSTSRPRSSSRFTITASQYYDLRLIIHNPPRLLPLLNSGVLVLYDPPSTDQSINGFVHTSLWQADGAIVDLDGTVHGRELDSFDAIISILVIVIITVHVVIHVAFCSSTQPGLTQ